MLGNLQKFVSYVVKARENIKKVPGIEMKAFFFFAATALLPL
jgi:hypothetical protein